MATIWTSEQKKLSLNTKQRKYGFLKYGRPSVRLVNLHYHAGTGNLLAEVPNISEGQDFL
jgi:hypothetical protein